MKRTAGGGDLPQPLGCAASQLLGCERWAAHNVRRTREVAQAIFGNYEIKRLQSIRGRFPVRRAGDSAQKLRRAGIAKKRGSSGRRRMRQHGTDGRSTRLVAGGESLGGRG